MRISNAAIAASLLSVSHAAGEYSSSARSAASAGSSSASSVASSASSAAASASAGLGERLSSLWGKVKSNMPAGAQIQMPSIGSLSSAAASAAAREVKNLTAQNWEAELGGTNGGASVLPAVGAASPWLVLFSGANQTCAGRCHQLDAAWTRAGATARVDPRAPQLAYVSCEHNRLLCATWGAKPGEAWWIEPARPALDADLPAVGAKVARKEKDEGAKSAAQHAVKAAAGAVHLARDVYVVPFNLTTVGADDITRLYKRAEYKTRGELLESESALSRHPFDGQLAKTGLLKYAGYVYFAVGMVPSWTFVMMLSMTARMFMQRQHKPKETAAQKAERERKEKYTDDGKVRGAPPGDGRSTGVI